MFAVVGLGNPGVPYNNTRHNLGFEVVDQLVLDLSGQWVRQGDAEVARIRVGEHGVIALKPLTFMNLSGEAVQRVVGFYKVPIDRLIVAHDEIDLAFGVVKIKRGGGEAGHNGLRSISACLGSQDYFRVRCGVGKPPNPRMDVAKWVLTYFDEAEKEKIPALRNKAVSGIVELLNQGLSAAQQMVAQGSAKSP